MGKKIAVMVATLGAVFGLMGAPAQASPAQAPADCLPILEEILKDLPYPYCS